MVINMLDDDANEGADADNDDNAHGDAGDIAV
jgi:hypothetical protein